MRLIDADALIEWLKKPTGFVTNCEDCEEIDCLNCTIDEAIKNAPTIDAEPVRHGRWVLTAHKESANYGWNVTADCSECGYEKGEIYAAYFPGFPDALARDVLMDNAKTVKLENYCPHCGAKMDGGAGCGTA